VAEEAWEAGPFAGIDDLHAAMVAAVERAPRTRRLELIRAHPDLAGRAAVAGAVSAESTREQASAGLDRLTPEEYEELTRLNTLYARNVPLAEIPELLRPPLELFKDQRRAGEGFGDFCERVGVDALQERPVPVVAS